MRHRLLARTAPAAQGGLLYVGELHGEALQPKMDHLVCFLPGARRLAAFVPVTWPGQVLTTGCH